MKKNSILFGILACSVFGTFAMEECQVLTDKEAKSLYWETARAEFGGKISYGDYRNNMMRAIPLLDFAQDIYSDPLYIAILKNDYDFAEFLLKYKANPGFRGKTQQSAFEALQLADENDPEVKMMKNLLRKYE